MKLKIYQLLFLLLFCCVFNIDSFATHNRAGVITYRQTGNLTFDFTITTYTKVSVETDRPQLYVNFGDNTEDSIPRKSQIILDPPYDDIYVNIYETQHTYNASGTYTIFVEDPNRNDGVVNIPGSVNIPFYIETIMTINPLLGGVNNSPRPLQPPVDIGYKNYTYYYTPNAYDEDGDSLSYSLVPCKGAGGLTIPTYSDPESSNSLSIDKITGLLKWDTPQETGEYNIAILIEEYRKVNGKYFQIGSVILDMQILVLESNNDPPQIFCIDSICVIAGEKISFDVLAVDTGEVVTLTATSGPHQLSSSPAQFTQPVSGMDSITSTYVWQTNCSHVRESHWQATFHAVDNHAVYPMSVYKITMIWVKGPPVQNLAATATGNNIDLTWDKYNCSNIKGYRIYRRIGKYGFNPDSCENGVPSYTGYTFLSDIDNRNTISYQDDNNGEGLNRGLIYCYLITALFDNPGDAAESIASEEACDTLAKDLPVITNVSVGITDVAAGIDTLIWSKPVISDSSNMPGPYMYHIYRYAGINGADILYTLIDSAMNINDTILIDSNLNTVKNPYSYRIDFYNNSPGNRFLVGSSQAASSIFLTIKGADNELELNWDFKVPWLNTKYDVYKKNDTTGLYDSLTTTANKFYTDTHLVNLKEYCYLIKGIGSYSAPGYKPVLINFSQTVCGTPIDTVPTCPPVLTASNDCSSSTGVNCSKSVFYNILSWTNPNDTCENNSDYDDAIKYVIYYSPYSADTISKMIVLDTVQSPLITDTIHELTGSIAGCYAVTTIDSFYNESAPSNFVCLDNCPIYELPNIFTPNNDNANDNFKPLNPYCFIESVNTKIFNRWGQMVFEEKTDTDINWNGNHRSNNRSCPPGVYYYVCTITEKHLNGTSNKLTKGFVHLLK